jgi:hypothetical protein
MMAIDRSVNYELVQIALEKASGSIFEKFVNGFYPSIAGENFIPLGGNKDGGADAFQGDSIWEGGKTGTFYQASTEIDHRSKIARTVKRLRDFGRTTKRLIYVTSQVIQHIDVEEIELSSKHDVDVRLRDRSYIISHINDTVGTREAYATYLQPLLAFLAKIGAASNLAPTRNVTSPAIYVFLRQEIERQEGKEGLVNALADGLILWALEETDPDKDILMAEKEIAQKISSAVPASVKMLKGVIKNRLSKLSTGSRSRERAIRFYKKRGLYCLAYEFRKVVAADNASDELIRISVRDIFIKKLQAYGDLELSAAMIQLAADVSFTVIQRIFENQGLEFAAFLERGEHQHSLPTILDYVDECLDQIQVRTGQRQKIKEAVLRNLQSAFYASEEAERIFFSRLSATYTLLFCLNTEPRIVEYFQGMKADFYLYVGADLLVRALSERYLRSADQATRNALRIIQEAGGKLVLAKPVLEEVHAHIRSSDSEFINFYKPIESSITLEVARNSDRILLRAYYYAKFAPPEGIVPPQGWEQFVNQFCDPKVLGTSEGQEQIKNYLISQFGMRFEDKDELCSVTNQQTVEKLAEQLRHRKKSLKLAENDALMALAVYGRRRKRGETSQVSEYGYRTWWLTGESTILNYTRDLIKQEGAKYIMRPEFLLNFLALAPSAADVRESYRTIFPSILGIRLARRVDSSELHKVLSKLAEAQELEPGRRQAKISQLSDELKTLAFSKVEKEAKSRVRSL